MKTEEVCTCEDCRIRSLANYLDVSVDDITETRYKRGEHSYDYANETYLILTDEEADEVAGDEIRNNLWTFNASWIIEHSKLPWDALEMVQTFQEKECEDAQDTIEALIDDMDEFIEDSIGADGRGAFISHYDGEEHEVDGFYIYRTD